MAENVLSLIEILKKNDYDGYIQYLQANLPEKLYRYCSHTNQNISTIISSKILLSNPRYFNDPFDSLSQEVYRVYIHYYKKIDRTIQRILYSRDKKVKMLRDAILRRNILSRKVAYKEKFKILEEEKQKIIKPNADVGLEDIHIHGILWEIKQISGFTNRYLGDFVSDSGVFCLTEEKNNIIMHSHYGKAHRGFCIEYKTNNIIQDVLNGKYFIVPLYYSDIIYTDYSEQIYSERLTYLWNLPQFMYKKKQWEYEKEWRIVKFDSSDHQLDFDYINTIYLGASFENVDFVFNNNSEREEKKQIDYLIKLFDYCSEKGIKIIPLRAATHKYGLEELDKYK